MNGSDPAANPFVEFRHDLDLHRRAISVGLSDEEFVDLVGSLDERVRAVAGVGFVITPFVLLDLPDADREVWAKVETGGVGGSHKARHLFGLLLLDEIDRRASAGPGRQPASSAATLAIASCGNAALAAAIVARAGERALEVFVPVDADPLVLDRLDDLGAVVVRCARRPGEPGDPCIARLAEAVAGGAQAFTVQGTTCPDAFDGARTLGLELASQVEAAGVGTDRGSYDLYVQIGGGALAVATMDGLLRAAARAQRSVARPEGLRREPRLLPAPRLHPVQARQAHPFAAAWERLVPRLLDAVGVEAVGVEAVGVEAVGVEAAGAATEQPAARAARLQSAARRGLLDGIIDAADDVMQPWPGPPTSVATGILDDVTYDWRPLVAHQLRSGGWPVLVGEDDLVGAAGRAAHLVTPPPDATGAAGLAGALADPVTDRSAVVILSGVDRAWERRDRTVGRS